MNNPNLASAQVGDVIGPLSFPISVYRLVVAAGAKRDFNSIHHDSEYAKAGGARNICEHTVLQGMWERAVRDYIGNAETIRRLAGFRMKSFNCAGETVVVKGEATPKWQDDNIGFADVGIRSENGDRISVGPGTVTVTLPLKRRDDVLNASR